MAELPPTETILRARAGDLTAFESVVRAYQPMALSYAWSILRDYHVAEDAVQDAFVTAWKSFDALREPDAFVGWLRRLVFTQCNRRQRRAALPTVDLDTQSLASPAPLPDADVERQQRRDMLAWAVTQLSDVLRETVLLHYYGGHSQKEIAAILDIPATTVGKRLHDARTKLQGKVMQMRPQDIERQRFARRVIDRVVSIPFDSTVLGTVVPTLRASGVDLSWSRAAGVLGHAFTFSMHPGCGPCCWHGNIDWWLFFDRLESLGLSFRTFQAIQSNPNRQPLSEADLARCKQETWEHATASIDRGVPAIAWGPMTAEQQREGESGDDFLVWPNLYRRNLINWALLVGYDRSARTYVVRHPVLDNREYDVPFDGFGTLDPVSWYCVLVPDHRVEVDRPAVAERSLRDAVDFAQGTRYEPNNACYGVETEGFAAFELWRDDVRAGTASTDHAVGFARLLTALRTAAADFVVEVSADLPVAFRPALRSAETAYRRQLDILADLVPICEQVRQSGRWTPDARTTAAQHIDSALEQERIAIEAIADAIPTSHTQPKDIP